MSIVWLVIVNLSDGMKIQLFSILLFMMTLPFSDDNQSKSIMDILMEERKYMIEYVKEESNYLKRILREYGKHADDKLKLAIKLLMDRVNNDSETLLQRMNLLNHENQKLSEKVADLDLKSETVSRYLEERICVLEEKLLLSKQDNEKVPPYQADGNLFTSDDLQFLWPSEIFHQDGSLTSPPRDSRSTHIPATHSTPVVTLNMAVETTPESPILFVQVDGNNTISTEPNTSSSKVAETTHSTINSK